MVGKIICCCLYSPSLIYVFCVLDRGADEMLPVLSYIILKTEQPRLVTECYALMEFIDER